MRVRGLVLVAALLTGCRAPARPAASGPALIRLDARLGTPAPVRLDQETRPSIALRAGEERRCTVELHGEGTLLFAIGTVKGPDRGRLHVTVEAGGQSVFDQRVAVGRHDHWWRRSATLRGDGPTEIVFRVALEGEGALPDQPWILLGSPRIVQQTERPRRVLVWISQDALRADHLGPWGYTVRPTSPRLDERAPTQVVFEEAISTAPWTLPSLGSQFTSRHPSTHGAIEPELAIGADSRTVFEALAADGFTVLGVTGNVFVSAEYDLQRGFDALWYMESRGPRVNDVVREALEEAPAGDLALFVHYIDPHAPYAPGEAWRAMVPPYSGPLTGGSFDFPAHATPVDVEHLRALYDAEIAGNDDAIADLRRDLDRRGLLAGAVEVYSADHGEEFQEHGGWRHGSTLYREALHVPLALRVPGVTPRRVRTPVTTLDLAPTILDAFGIPPPASFEGRSLLPALRSGAEPTANSLFAETQLTDGHHRALIVRLGVDELIVDTSRPPGQVEVRYDLAKDPGERQPLPVKGEAGSRLQRLAEAYMSAHPVARSTRSAMKDDTRERLKALGYLP